jgi:hypothetical protein
VQITIITFKGYNEQHQLVAAGILNRMRRQGGNERPPEVARCVRIAMSKRFRLYQWSTQNEQVDDAVCAC